MSKHALWLALALSIPAMSACVVGDEEFSVEDQDDLLQTAVGYTYCGATWFCVTKTSVTTHIGFWDSQKWLFGSDPTSFVKSCTGSVSVYEVVCETTQPPNRTKGPIVIIN